MPLSGELCPHSNPNISTYLWRRVHRSKDVMGLDWTEIELNLSTPLHRISLEYKQELKEHVHRYIVCSFYVNVYIIKCCRMISVPLLIAQTLDLACRICQHLYKFSYATLKGSLKKKDTYPQDPSTLEYSCMDHHQNSYPSLHRWCISPLYNFHHPEAIYPKVYAYNRYHWTNAIVPFQQTRQQLNCEPEHPPISHKRTHRLYQGIQNTFYMPESDKTSMSLSRSWTRSGKGCNRCFGRARGDAGTSLFRLHLGRSGAISLLFPRCCLRWRKEKSLDGGRLDCFGEILG